MLRNININNYPRTNSEKFMTDKIILTFLINKNYLESIKKSVDKAQMYFNQCKDYFFTFSYPNTNIRKTYNGKDIINLMKVNINDISRYSKMDQLYYYYYRNRNFYMNLFKAIEYSKENYLKKKIYSIIISPPFDFYDKGIILDYQYDMIELIELLLFSQKLIKKRKIYNLPFPKLWLK